MATYQYAVTKVQEFFGEISADSEEEATRLVKNELEFAHHNLPDTEDVILNLYRVDDE